MDERPAECKDPAGRDSEKASSARSESSDSGTPDVKIKAGLSAPQPPADSSPEKQGS